MSSRLSRRCVRCDEHALLVDGRARLVRDVAGHHFVADVAARVCPACGETYFASAVVERFELHVAKKLAEAGLANGETLRFMRKAVRMQANTLATLLGVAPETVSRWELDRRAVQRSTFAVVAGLVRDAFEGRRTTSESLRRLAQPKPLPRKVNIVLRDSTAEKPEKQ